MLFGKRDAAPAGWVARTTARAGMRAKTDRVLTTHGLFMSPSFEIDAEGRKPRF